MLKKLLHFIVAVILILALTLTGCGGSSRSNNSDINLINELLDKFQSGMVNENFELVASLCAFELYWIMQTFKDPAEFLAMYEKVTAVDVCEFSNRVILVNGDSATVDAYYRLAGKVKNEKGEEVPQDNTFSVKITVIKVNGTWKVSRIELSTDIEKHLINNLLDRYQTAMKNMDADTLVSLCRFPFTDNSVQYNDAAAMKTAYQTKFAQTESFSVYEIKNRVFKEGVINMLTASIHIKKKPLGGDWLEYIEEYNIAAEKVDEVWKVFGMVRKEDQ